MKQLEDRGITIKAGMVYDAAFIKSDPSKNRRKKPPGPVDLEFAEMTKDVKEGTSEKDEAVSEATGKWIRKE